MHRDIKTANTMWTRDRKAKIMDFGLAKVVEEVRNHTTIVSGTPYYMSPEQTLGKNVDHRTDIYSLGRHALRARDRHGCPSRRATSRTTTSTRRRPTRARSSPTLPALLAEIVARCLQKDPAERFESAREILAQVRAAMARSRTASA